MLGEEEAEALLSQSRSRDLDEPVRRRTIWFLGALIASMSLIAAFTAAVR